MAKTQTRSWDPAEHLETKEDMAAYLSVALEEGDLSLVMATFGDIARAQRMAVVAKETGLGRESLYKSLSANGNPKFATVLKLVRALGLQLQASALGVMANQPTDKLRFRNRRHGRLMDIVRPFESQPSSRHIRDAMGAIERLRDEGRQFWQADSDELARWREGCTELWVFLNTLSKRRDIDKQPLESALREFVQAFEHTAYRMTQMLHGLREQAESGPQEVDRVFRWAELVFRLSTYGLVSYWIDDKTEEKTVGNIVDLATGERSEETVVTKEMHIPRKYRSSARLGRDG